MNKTFVVCDYPNPKNYTFPSFGFGSSEKRLWQVAKSLSELPDLQVIITGPLWLPEHTPRAIHFPKRLDASTVDEFLAIHGKADYLFAGHEYFDKKYYTDAFFRAAHKLSSYVLHPYDFGPDAVFDAKRAFLFCYSDEMRERYLAHKPIQLFLYHSGVGEEAYLTPSPKDYLVWMGRLDAHKAPHYAILAADLLGMPIKILGKSVYDETYAQRQKETLAMPHVQLLGTVFGPEKMKLLSEAKVALYTCSADYSEAGAGTLGEILCSGVPIAGMSWKGNDAVCAAVSRPELGRIIRATTAMSDHAIAGLLADAVHACSSLDREQIRSLACRQYDMNESMKTMMRIMDSGSV